MTSVSVIIPSYNHAAFIGQAVASVLNQTYTELELIVVDDGSTDQSLDVLAGIADPRLCVIRQPNLGAHAAINRGLSEATGQYLSILNSDDVYDFHRLKKCVELLKAEPATGLVGSYIEVIDSQGHTLGVKHGYRDLEPWLLEEPQRSFRASDDLHAAVLTENYWATTSNFVMSRAWLERIGSFRPLRYTHDWDFVLRMAREAQLVMLPEPLLQYRVHSQNTIRENQAAMIFEICWCLAVHLPQHLQLISQGETALTYRIDQLLHSIYTFNLDHVLSVMLVQDLAHHPDDALCLLDAEDPTRKIYLNFIERKLAMAESANHLAVDHTESVPPPRAKCGLGQIMRRLGKRT
jgi:glycosyltransferase involved in cell wall biosynthesis